MADRSPTATPRASAPTLAEVRSWPTVVGVPKACSALGISASYGYVLVRRGEFPAKVLKLGSRVVVVTASIVAALEAA